MANNIKHNEYAILSEEAYKDRMQNEQNQGFKEAQAAGWEYAGSSDDFGLSKEGYFGVAFKKGNDVVIAHRGTNFLEASFGSDIDDDISLLNKKIPAQTEFASKFVMNVMAKHKDCGCNFTNTGHSLAATHSQLTGIQFNIPSVVFDSPGTMNLARSMFPEEKIASYAKENLVIYNSAPNAINSGTGPHITNPVHVKVESSFHQDSKLGYLGHTWEQHQIKSIGSAFDQKSGLPKESSQYETWPIGENAFDHFKKNVFNTISQPVKLVVNGVITAEEFAQRHGIDSSRVKVESFTSTEQPFHAQRTFTIEPPIESNYKAEFGRNSGYSDLFSNSYDSLRSFYTTAPNREQKPTFEPFKLTKSIWDINEKTVQNDNFGDPIIDSFISGKYKGFNSLQSNLFEPFTDWRGKYTPTQDVLDQLKNLKLFGFSKIYNPLSPSEYISSFDQFKQQHSKNSYTDNLSNYFLNTHKNYLNNPYKVDYTWQQQKIQPGRHNPNQWQQSVSNSGRAVKYTAPNGAMSVQIGISRPIAIDLKDDGIKFVNFNESSIFFDTDNDGYKENVSWVSNEDGVIFYDENEDGLVTEAKELILTKLDDKAKTDFDVLVNKFDNNKDNIIDFNDADFSKLKIWQDQNQNGVSEDSEVKDLKYFGIKSINLNFTKPNVKFAEDNFISNIAKVDLGKDKKLTIYDWGMIHSKHGIKFSQEDNYIKISFKTGKDEIVYDADKGSPLALEMDESPFDLIIATSFNDKISVKNHTGAALDLGDGDDVVNFEKGNNWVKGGRGKDIIKTGSGHDILFIDADDQLIDAGEGHDVGFVSDSRAIKLSLSKANLEAVYGNKGNDYLDGSGKKSINLHGNAGDDILIGSDAQDIIVGGPGKDTIKAGKGDDYIFIDDEDELTEIDAGEGDDSIFINSQKDVTIELDLINAETCYGGFGNDKISAKGSKNYVLYGNEGNDVLQGGKGKTIFDGGPGNDILKGGVGKNLYVFNENSGHDTIESKGKKRAGDAKDFVLIPSSIELRELSFERDNSDLLMRHRGNESTLRVSKWFKGDIHKVNGFIYRAEDKKASKNIIIIEKSDEINLNAKNDWIIFTLGDNSFIKGNKGSEIVRFGKGNDHFFSNGGKDIVYGGKGDDVLQTWSDKKYKSKDGVTFHGEDGDDVLFGSIGNDVLNGGPGNDFIFGFEGDDIIYTGGGDENISTENDRADGGPGNDVIYMAGSGGKRIEGGKGTDKFIITPNNYDNNSIYVLMDFEIGNQNEVIDFSRIPEVKSFLDLEPETLNLEIDPNLHGKTLKSKPMSVSSGQKKHTIKAPGLCWKTDEKDGSNHCVFLANANKEMLLTADNAGQFIYAQEEGF